MRLADGSLASVTEAELAEHRPTYVSSHAKRRELDFVLDRRGRHPTVTLDEPSPSPSSPPQAVAPSDASFADVVFEARIGAYLKATEEWAPPDQAPPAERHFIRKKRRARLFEARSEST